MKKFIENIKHAYIFIKTYRLMMFDRTNLKAVQVKTAHILSFLLVIVLTGVCVWCAAFYHGTRYAEKHTLETGELFYYEDPVTILIDGVEPEEFSEEKLVEMLLRLNVKFPDVVVAQAQLESGNYTSHIFNENNNLFGMKEAKSRIHMHEGTQHGHAKYSTWKQCVLDYAFYQASYLSNIKTKDQYIAYLDSSYASIGGEYGNRLRKKLGSINEKYTFK